jgi:hypothetical protein
VATGVLKVKSTTTIEPAHTHPEWKLIQLLFKGGVSKQWIDEFLSLRMVNTLLYRNANTYLYPSTCLKVISIHHPATLYPVSTTRTH